MKTITCDWSTIHHHGEIWFDHLRLRKAAFVDGEGWDVPHTQDVEWDQYDTPLTKYIITHENGRVLAASRVLPCSYDGPNHSFMIRDAMLGRLPNIPPDICESVCTDQASYEATRFTTGPDLPRRMRVEALKTNAVELMLYCDKIGAERVYALMPPGFVAWLRRTGLDAREYGPRTTNALGETFCVIECRRPFFRAEAVPKSA